MTMQNKTVRSGMAVTAASLIVHVLKIGSIIVLARILEPSDFGLISLAAVLIGSADLFARMGMAQALIATKEEVNRAAYHVGLMTFGVASLLTVLVWVFAPEFAQFFEKEELTDICRWLSVVLLIDMLMTVPMAILSKEMMFGRLIFPKTAGAISSIVVAVSMAYSGFGVWSLVGGQIASGVVRLVTIFGICPTLKWLKPHRWDSSLAKDMARFGFKTMSAILVRHAYSNADNVVVGKAFGVTELGFYTQAFGLSNIPVTNISMVTSTVLFPAYGKIREDTERLAKAFLNAFQMLAVITIPLAAAILTLAPEFVIFLIGEKWRNSIPILQCFALLSLVRPLSGSTSPLFLALNKPEYNLWVALANLGGMAVLIFAFLPWGVTGVAFGVGGAFGLGFLFNLYLLCNRTGMPIQVRDILRRVFAVLPSTLAMAGAIIWMKAPLLSVVGGVHNLASLGVLVLGGLGVYALSIFITQPSLFFKILDIGYQAAGRKKNGATDRGPNQRIDLLMKKAKSGVKRYLPQGLLEKKLNGQLVIEGCPVGLPVDHIMSLAAEHLGHSNVEISHQHLSGWKDTGAFRIILANGNSRPWSLIYKNALYGEENIFGLIGLPILPGPPEYTIHQLGDRRLIQYLPKIYLNREIVPGKHYQYLMEDLSNQYRKSKEEKRILGFCKQLPSIHTALDETFKSSEDSSLLRFDQDFSVKILDYGEENLTQFHEKYHSVECEKLLGKWDEIKVLYLSMLKRIYSMDVVGAIHGDLNATNVMFHTRDPAQMKLIDWEWAGYGVRYSDLVSLFKWAPSDLEARGLQAYQQARGETVTREIQSTYQWCKLQRGIFDGAFFAKQLMGSEDSANMKSPLQYSGIAKALRRSLDALGELKKLT